MRIRRIATWNGQPEPEGDARSGLALRLALGGVVTLGAIASGFLASRQGRRLVVETFRGNRRGPLADRVLDRLLDDPALRRRRLDADQTDDGAVRILGSVASDDERATAVRIAAAVPGVSVVRDLLVLDPSLPRRRPR